ncbi:MAG: ATP-binding protein, partial [Bacteroidota bacterium]
ASTEAVNNAIMHGNKSDQTKKVHVRCELLPGWLVVFVSDEGAGFKVDKIRNPLKKQNLLRENGRGIFLMRTLMDKVEFEVGPSGAQVALWLDMNK